MSMTDSSFFWLQMSKVAGVSGVPSHAAQFHAVVGWESATELVLILPHQALVSTVPAQLLNYRYVILSHAVSVWEQNL